ncbi:MAG: sigma-70 family RNA polymerase sigma factor [Chitinispirillaceae bacterium]|nr:sigma-70 family RNA polymerase sigma factor [Chitinispirillaceae bacterium]
MERRTLVAFVRGLIDDAADRDAEDIVQEVAFHFFEKGDIIEPVEHLGAYVYQALRNRVVDSYRRKRPIRSLDEPVEEGKTVRLADVVADVAGDPRVHTERSDLYRRSLLLMRKLPERDQALIIATEIEGYSFAELADRWKVPVGTLLARKSRSLKKIRETLQSFA